jgi:hypothetical protein
MFKSSCHSKSSDRYDDNDKWDGYGGKDDKWDNDKWDNDKWDGKYDDCWGTGKDHDYDDKCYDKSYEDRNCHDRDDSDYDKSYDNNDQYVS